jgi:hypothetical protein
LTGRSAAKRQGKGAVKKMGGMFDDIAKDSEQALMTAALNMNSRATELCNGAICNLVYKQHHAVGPSTIDTADKTLLFNSDIYGWMPHNASFGFLDMPRPALGRIYF